MNPGRRIQIRNRDYHGVVEQMGAKTQYTSQRVGIDSATTTYGDEALIYEVLGTSPSIQFIENAMMHKGRFLNYLDEERRNK